MSEALQQFHFLREWWLIALVALPLLGWVAVRRTSGPLELSRLVDPELLPHLLRGRARHRYLPVWLFALGWVLAALALAGPTWSRIAQPLYASRAAQVVAISLSRHMLSRDVAPSRIDRARYKARDLLGSNHDGLNALVGYAGEAFVVAPLTSDAGSLGELLEAMSPDTMPVDGDNAAAAIERGVTLIHDANAEHGSIVLITDQADAAADAAARKANAAGVHVSVLGTGTPQGGPVPLDSGGFLQDEQGHMTLARRDDASLDKLAAAGGGIHVTMTADHADIDALQGQLSAGPASAVVGKQGDEWQDRGPWLLLPLLIIVALTFRRGWLLLLPMVLLPMLPTKADATTWSDLWRRPDQQAAKALRQGQAKQAQQLARDPAWRGAAAYRAGDFAGAAQSLQQLPGADAAYNLGNALAKQGEYQKATAAYDRALKLDPSHADAKANRKAVEDWLKQQKQQQDQQQSQKKHEGGKGGKNSSSQDGQGSNDKSDAQQKQDDKSSQSSSDKSAEHSQSAKQDQDGKNQTGDAKDKPGDQPNSETPQQQAEQKARAEKAQQALKQQMDKALGAQEQKKDQQGKPPTHQLGATAADDPQSKLPADLQHALQRVPDDPGALLRRKFELEYQQRHSDATSEDEQP
jgi:Ca-activated chloride channel family protein